MKILQIINSLATGGAEKLLLDTLPLYHKAGIEMDILLFWDNNKPFTNALKALNCCTIIILNESENFKDIYSIKNIMKLKSFLIKYDVAHVHLFPAQYFTVLANGLNGNKTKLVFTEHSTSNRRIKNRFFRIVDAFFYKFYDKIIAINEEVKDALKIYHNLNNGKIVIINNGVDTFKFFNSNPLERSSIIETISHNTKLLIQVSSFQNPKDQLTVINSLKILPDNIKLILVGTGVLKDQIEAYTKMQNLQNRVFFLGQRMDVPQLLKSADIVILSSKYEGMSLSSIEGMASGKPFIASNVKGLANIVKGAGVLFQQGNEKELATKILELLENPILYNKVVEACLERAILYDIQIMVKKHIDLYNIIYNEK